MYRRRQSKLLLTVIFIFQISKSVQYMESSESCFSYPIYKSGLKWIKGETPKGSNISLHCENSSEIPEVLNTVYSVQITTDHCSNLDERGVICQFIMILANTSDEACQCCGKTNATDNLCFFNATDFTEGSMVCEESSCNVSVPALYMAKHCSFPFNCSLDEDYYKSCWSRWVKVFYVCVPKPSSNNGGATKVTDTTTRVSPNAISSVAIESETVINKKEVTTEQQSVKPEVTEKDSSNIGVIAGVSGAVFLMILVTVTIVAVVFARKKKAKQPHEQNSAKRTATKKVQQESVAMVDTYWEWNDIATINSNDKEDDANKTVKDTCASNITDVTVEYAVVNKPKKGVANVAIAKDEIVEYASIDKIKGEEEHRFDNGLDSDKTENTYHTGHIEGNTEGEMDTEYFKGQIQTNDHQMIENTYYEGANFANHGQSYKQVESNADLTNNIEEDYNDSAANEYSFTY